jgi:hypothetical protein
MEDKQHTPVPISKKANESLVDQLDRPNLRNLKKEGYVKTSITLFDAELYAIPNSNERAIYIPEGDKHHRDKVRKYNLSNLK